MSIASAVTLPSGVEIPNRLAKAAMTEGLAGAGGRAGLRLTQLYETWAAGGAGLLITGNIMVDGRYRERPGNVVVEGEPDAAARGGLESLAQAAKAGGGVALAQLSHAGRQSPKAVTAEPVGPSAVPMKLPGGLFGAPRALSADETRDVVDRFGRSAKALCRFTPPTAT